VLAHRPCRSHRVAEGSHVLQLGVLEVHDGGLLSDLIVLLEAAVGATIVVGRIERLSTNGVDRVLHVNSIYTGVIWLWLKKHLLVQQIHHVLIKVVANILVVDVHLHLIHLVVCGKLWLV